LDPASICYPESAFNKKNKFNMTKVYIKTPKGIAELLSPRASIHPHLASLLLLIDSRRTIEEVQDLVRRNSAPADSLEMLEHGGFIAQRELPAGVATAQVSRKGAPAPAPVVHLPVKKPASQELDAFQSLYEHLAEAAKQHLGLFKGLQVQLSIERAGNVEDLRNLIKPIADAIARKQGLESGNEFKQSSERLIRRITGNTDTFLKVTSKFQESRRQTYDHESSQSPFLRSA